MPKPFLLTVAILAVAGVFIFGSEKDEASDSGETAAAPPKKSKKTVRNSKGQFV